MAAETAVDVTGPACPVAGRERVVVGVGARSGAHAQAVVAGVRQALDEAGVTLAQVEHLATLDTRTGDPVLIATATRLGVALRGHPAARLAAVRVPHPSPSVRSAVGTPSVAEAAALHDAGDGELLVAKFTPVGGQCTVAVARVRSGAPAAVEGGAGEPDLRHHGDAEVRAGAAAPPAGRSDATGLVDLAVNVRAGTPPSWLRTHLSATLGELASYPDAAAARAAVAARHGRPAEEVLLTAGAAEAFVLLARALRPRHAVVVHPQFTEPEAALRDAGHDVDRVLLPPDPDSPERSFRLDPDAVPASADLVVLGNPTNPTSTLHPASDVAALTRPGRVVVVDEAFADTVPGERNSLAARRDLPGLLVLRSLTKTWGLAGLRVGYLLADADVTARIQRCQPLWPVSTPALAAAEVCSAPAALDESEQAARELVTHRAHLVAELGAVPGVQVHGAPEASFVLVRMPAAETVRLRLRELGFAVRRGDTFPGLGPDWLRIAVRAPEVSDALVAALRTVVRGKD